MKINDGDIPFTEIKDFEVESLNLCDESMPCEHSVKIFLKNGSIYTCSHMNRVEITRLYSMFGRKIPEHFSDESMTFDDKSFYEMLCEK